jgi:hypothetical protein
MNGGNPKTLLQTQKSQHISILNEEDEEGITDEADDLTMNLSDD